MAKNMTSNNPNKKEWNVKEIELSRPLIQNNCFKNPWPTWKNLTLMGVTKFQFFTQNLTSLPGKEIISKMLPLHVISDDEIKSFCREDSQNRIKLIWIGHSTCLINIANKIVLTDPIFSKRSSPTQIIGPKRFVDVPISIERIPRVDAVVISHNHYDHLDYQSIIELNRRFGSTGLKWFVGSGTKELFISMGIYDNIQEMSWWDEYEFRGLKFVFTPAQHWSNRNAFDVNKCLWGSWTILSEAKRLFFAGDTGYCSVFGEEVGPLYGPFDLALIPIGAYHPREILHPQHIDPEQAVQIHIDLNSKQSCAIHWGTFALAKEFYLAPKEELVQALDKLGVSPDDFITLLHGATYKF